MNFTKRGRRIGLNIALLVAYLVNLQLCIINTDDNGLRIGATLLSSAIVILFLGNNNLFRE